MTSVLREGEVPAVWWATVIECRSALQRRHREVPLPGGVLDSALRRLERYLEQWDIVPPTEEVRRRASRLLAVHALRATDALQLGAAVVLSAEVEGVGFVCLEDRLRTAASKEGFRILPNGAGRE
jgi:predicted nucleic acid-binding protein